MVNKIIIVVLVTISLIFTIFTWWYFTTDGMFLPQGYNFCVDKGYESTSYLGSYNSMEGRVECVSCYKRDCQYKEFNVTKKFGIIMEEFQ